MKLKLIDADSSYNSQQSSTKQSEWNVAFQTEQVGNDSDNRLQPPVMQCGSYVRVPNKESATKRKSNFRRMKKKLQRFNRRL